MRHIIVLYRNIGYALANTLIIYKSFSLANYCFYLSGVPVAQGLPFVEGTYKQLVQRFPGSKMLALDRDFLERKAILIRIAREIDPKFIGMCDDQVGQLLRFDESNNRQIGNEYFLWTSANQGIKLSDMTDLQRESTLNVSLTNWKQARKLCKTGMFFTIGSFVIDSFGMIQYGWLRRFSFIFGLGQLIIAIEMSNRVHPDSTFPFFSPQNTVKQYELRLIMSGNPKTGWILGKGYQQLRNAVIGVLIVFLGGPISISGFEIPNESVPGGILKMLKKPYDYLFEKTIWLTATSTREYFTSFQEYKNLYVESMRSKDISNKQIIDKLRELCIDAVDGEIEEIFLDKQRFCSFDQLYDEHKCNELYSRLEELRVTYTRFCSNSGKGNDSVGRINFKEVFNRFGRWWNFKKSSASKWRKLVFGGDAVYPRQTSDFTMPQALIEGGGAYVHRLRGKWYTSSCSPQNNPQGVVSGMVDISEYLINQPINPAEEKIDLTVYRKLKSVLKRSLKNRPNEIKEIAEPVIKGQVINLRLKGSVKIVNQKIRNFAPFRIRP